MSVGSDKNAKRSLVQGFLIALLSLGLLGAMPGAGTTQTVPNAEIRPVLLVDVDGAIGVGTSHQIERALEAAREKNSELLVLRLDTPGGLVSSTREIIKSILSSPVPVAVYVAPSGARAASAGTYIAYSAHISAMAPGTHLGAATPIPLSVPGLPGAPTPQKPQDGDKETSGKKEGETASDRKVLNDAVAFITSLAELRGRNKEWAEKAVRDAATLTSSAALSEKVVDYLAADVDDLLRQVHGRTIKTPAGERLLATSGKPVVQLEPDWRTRFITAVTDPNVAFILLVIGIYGIIFEFWTPGLAGPGVIGAIALLVALAALSTLPVSYAGLGLILLGIALMLAEAFAPGFGILGIGGSVAFIAGALFLFDPAGADIEFGVGWPVAIGAAVTTGVLLAGVLGLAIKARYRSVITGTEDLIGAKGTVKQWNEGMGRIRVHGELWGARGDGELKPGDKIRVVGLDGLTLEVEPIRERTSS